MLSRKLFIHYLLAACIGLLSVMNASADFDEQPSVMHGCQIECDAGAVIEPGPCTPEGCESMTTACGSFCSATIYSETPLNGNIALTRVARPHYSPADFLSRLSFSIYRPPIA